MKGWVAATREEGRRSRKEVLGAREGGLPNQ